MGSRKAVKPRAELELPDKQYFKIGEVAAIAGVKPSVLRYWETCFPQIRPEKTRAQQRLYGRRHVACVLEIKDLLYARGFTISGARRHLGGRAGAVAKDELLEKLRRELTELLQLVDE
jgi:DNA-binding transcriptional MerR regulator